MIATIGDWLLHWSDINLGDEELGAVSKTRSLLEREGEQPGLPTSTAVVHGEVSSFGVALFTPDSISIA